MGKRLFEQLLRRPVEASVASEFRYSDPLVDEETLVVLISQSGETADTLAAMREAKAKGATTLAIVNVVGSTLARDADARSAHAGRAGDRRGLHQSVSGPTDRPGPARPLSGQLRGSK